MHTNTQKHTDVYRLKYMYIIQYIIYYLYISNIVLFAVYIYLTAVVTALQIKILNTCNDLIKLTNYVYLFIYLFY